MLRKDLVLVTLLVVILALMVVPISQPLMDVLLAINISLSVLLLMVAIYLKHPSDFSTFPSVILIGTSFRLALSIGTTRLILSEADAGQIIETFGEFVVAGSVAIGLVIFLIITVVQFLVITKGAERVAEVGARFALDALPGKQMSIDAEIRAGNLEKEEGTEMRKRLDRDSQFFGAMDGTMKFVKGDAIAGIIITVINLIGGVAVGVGIHSYSFSEAVSIYSLLTIGDGLVAQIPALLMALCAGIVVTRVANQENDDLGTDISRDLFSDARVPGVASAIVLGIGLIPGFPFWVFAGAAAMMFFTSMALRRALAKAATSSAAEEDAQTSPATQEEGSQAREMTRSTRFKIYFDDALSNDIDIPRLLAHSDQMFEQLVRLRGVNFPVPDMLSSENAGDRELVIELDEVPIHRLLLPEGTILIGCEREILISVGCPEKDIVSLPGLASGLYWVPAEYAADLAALNFQALEPEEILAEMIFRLYEQNIGLLFARTEFEAVLDAARDVDAPGVEAIEAAMPKAMLFQVFKYLVEDGVPLRPLDLLLDSLQHWVQVSEGAGPVLIAECMRGSMKRQLCHLVSSPGNFLGVAMVDPALEVAARNSISELKRSANMKDVDGLVLPETIAEAILNQFRKLLNTNKDNANQIAVIVSSDLRRRFRNFLAANDLHMPVLAPHEISANVKTHPITLIAMPNDERKNPAEPTS